VKFKDSLVILLALHVVTVISLKIILIDIIHEGKEEDHQKDRLMTLKWF